MFIGVCFSLMQIFVCVCVCMHAHAHAHFHTHNHSPISPGHFLHTSGAGRILRRKGHPK